MNEKELLQLVNEFYGSSLIKCEDQFSRWDADDEQHVVELKCRETHYDTQIIEYIKYDAVMQEANKSERVALYIASTPEEILVFDLTQLEKEGYELEWESKWLPATTAFANKDWIVKQVSYIENEKAKWRLNYESTYRLGQSDI